ncbi:hypothetical protein CEXT_606071 [Caerostris extrusa]|uniref:Uncharacterized protein n=1 Tax=Caerostris extrusa TaxID=172846 RepID=A0AAV4PTM9_CAEEX|nr:hypothetical protein CEXT_606071 [Caerostris extrusa]
MRQFVFYCRLQLIEQNKVLFAAGQHGGREGEIPDHVRRPWSKCRGRRGHMERERDLGIPNQEEQLSPLINAPKSAEESF